MRHARNEIKGDLEQQFTKVWSYCLEIDRTNPDSTYKVKLSNLDYVGDGGQKRFKRMYMCWDGCKEGFKHCRRIIGIDGCHLRGNFGGMILTTIGIDSNDSIFPIAYVVVEGENKESWCWFLQLLKVDLSINAMLEHSMTFVSDKQKELIPAFEEVLPNAQHRFCVRHLHSNMKVAGFQDKLLKDILWNAARATTINTYTAVMKRLKALDTKAFARLHDKEPSEWSRSHFTGDAKCDMLVNNISECFNSMIVDARECPLITCLEKIRDLLMMRLYENREKAKKLTRSICPTIVKKLAIIEREAARCVPIQCDSNLFQIREIGGSQHKVDLRRRSYSCRKWDLTGLPCKHAICSIWFKHGKGSIHQYVDRCYYVETYLKQYSGCINPMAGIDEWPATERVPPLPPLYKTKPGRPTKLRKKSAGDLTKDGTHLSRKHVTLHCTRCKKAGHNIRCPLNPRAAGNGQNREDGVAGQNANGYVGQGHTGNGDGGAGQNDMDEGHNGNED